MTPFSQGCTKLMEGKDKTQNKKEIIELLRKLADMLEEQEYTNTNPNILGRWQDDIANIANPNLQYPNYPNIDYPDQSGALIPQGPRLPNGGQLQPQAYVIADKVDCALWDDGCLLYTSPSPRDGLLSRMPSSA